MGINFFEQTTEPNGENREEGVTPEVAMENTGNSILVKDLPVDAQVALAKKTKNPSILTELAENEKLGILIALGGNPNSTKKILDDLSRRPEEKIQLAVAGNTSVDSDQLNNLSLSRCEDVLILVGANPKTRRVALDKLSKSSLRDVLLKVASNKNSSQNALFKVASFASSHKCTVCSEVLSNPTVTIGTVIKIISGCGEPFRRNHHGCVESVVLWLKKWYSKNGKQIIEGNLDSIK